MLPSAGWPLVAGPSHSPPPPPARSASEEEPFEYQQQWSGIIEQPTQPLPPKPKRKRVTPAQLEILVEMFQQTDTPSFEVREEVGARVGMTNREVQVWAQNRRAKITRQRQAAGAAAATAAGLHVDDPAPNRGRGINPSAIPLSHSHVVGGMAAPAAWAQMPSPVVDPGPASLGSEPAQQPQQPQQPPPPPPPTQAGGYYAQRRGVSVSGPPPRVTIPERRTSTAYRPVYYGASSGSEDSFSSFSSEGRGRRGPRLPPPSELFIHRYGSPLYPNPTESPTLAPVVSGGLVVGDDNLTLPPLRNLSTSDPSDPAPASVLSKHHLISPSSSSSSRFASPQFTAGGHDPADTASSTASFSPSSLFSPALPSVEGRWSTDATVSREREAWQFNVGGGAGPGSSMMAEGPGATAGGQRMARSASDGMAMSTGSPRRRSLTDAAEATVPGSAQPGYRPW